MAGLWCCGLGFGNAELVEADREQMAKLPYYHLFGAKTHEPAVELAERLKALAPVPDLRVFYQSSGSEANESQVKLAWYYNNAHRPAEQEEDHRPQEGLPRRHHHRGLADGAALQPPWTSTCRSTASCTPAARTTGRRPSWKARARPTSPPASSVELDEMIEREGPDTDRRLHRRAGDGRRRRHRAPEGYYEAVTEV
jgi:4-aminobutyrate---pyruvate transaminase